MIKVTCPQWNEAMDVQAIRVFKNPAAALNRHEVKALSAAIARGDLVAAATSLDALFRDEPVVGEWIALGRAKGRAGSVS